MCLLANGSKNDFNNRLRRNFASMLDKIANRTRWNYVLRVSTLQNCDFNVFVTRLQIED